jgi:hypothetical protein
MSSYGGVIGNGVVEFDREDYQKRRMGDCGCATFASSFMTPTRWPSLHSVGAIGCPAVQKKCGVARGDAVGARHVAAMRRTTCEASKPAKPRLGTSAAIR